MDVCYFIVPSLAGESKAYHYRTGSPQRTAGPAVEELTDALRLEAKPFGSKAVLIEPGSIDTGFEDVALATLNECSDPECYEDVRASFAKIIRSGYQSAPGPEVVVREVYKAITARNPKARYAAGRDAKMFIAMKGLLSDGLFDRMVASQL